MRSRIVLILIFSLGLCAARRFYYRYSYPGLRLLFFDVGQGDGALIQFPGGATLMVDAGGGRGDWNVGGRILFPELARLGILKLDVALLSHPDQDHGYGFLGLFDAIRVGELWIHEQPAGLARPLLEQLEARAARAHSTVRKITRPSRLQLGGATLDLFPLGESELATNDRSLVLELAFGGCRVLFTGDIERDSERELARLARFPVTLLKVAHHGSRTSTLAPFLRLARPRWAVISVGARNHYGHPNRSVLERLREAGTQVWRTDFHGFVELTISPEGEVECRSGQGSCGVGSCRAGI